jgi:NAD(P)H dehydrogenase (quinone)
MRSVTIITTMNKPKIMYSLLIGNLIRKVMLRSVFKTMGYKRLKWISFTSVKSVSQDKRKNWLSNLETRFSSFN